MKKFIFKRTDLIDEEILTLKEEIRLLTDPTTERYVKTVEALRKLEEIRQMRDKTKVKDWGPVIVATVTATASLIGIGMITATEETRAVTSRALAMIKRF